MEQKLYYKKEESRFTSTPVELTIPKKWGMFTPQGNASLKKKAETLVKNLLKIKNDNPNDYSSYVKAFDKYFKSYQRAADYSKVCSEATDTAVREGVWCFALNASKAVGISHGCLDDLWEVRHSYTRKSTKEAS